jgi:hypothetical protein
MEMEFELLDWEEGDPNLGRQDEFGIDLEEIRFNLLLTPTERYHKYRAGMTQFLLLHGAAANSRPAVARKVA